MNRFYAACFALVLAFTLRADTVVFKNGEELEGTILEKDETELKLEVENGTVLVPMVKVRRIDLDTPEKIAERARKKAEAEEFAKKMADEGKVLYKGKWMTEEEKKAAEDKLKAEQDKKKEAAAAAKKKADDEAAKAKEEAAKRAADLAQQNANNQNSRGDRFNRNRRGDPTGGQGLNGNNATTFNNGSNGYGNSYNNNNNGYNNNYNNSYNGR